MEAQIQETGNGESLLADGAKWIDGEWQTIDDVYQKHKGLVWQYAHKYRTPGLRAGADMKELHQIASMGLTKAYHKFDPDSGFKFSTLFGHWMDGYIRRYLREQSNIVHFPRSAIETGYAMVREQIEDKPNSEIAEILEVKEKIVERARDFLIKPQSTETEIYNDGTNPITLGETIPANDDLSHMFVEDFLKQLPDNLRTVTEGLLQEKTQHQIAEKLGVSQVQVSRLLKKVRELYIQYKEGEIIMESKPTHASVQKPQKSDEAKRLLKETDMTVNEIAKKTGLSFAGVQYHKKRMDKLTRSKAETESKASPKDKKAIQDDVLHKYNTLSEKHAKLTEENNRLHKQAADKKIEIEDLTNKVATMQMVITTAEEMISDKIEKLRDRNKDCDVLEAELSKMHTAYDKLKEWVKADMDVVS